MSLAAGPEAENSMGAATAGAVHPTIMASRTGARR
jgi:hypothetical protein